MSPHDDERTLMTFQVRFHGRGGQGVVTAAELLSVAAFLEGHHAQAFPSFGSERSGAPVVAYCRISDQPIRTHEPVVDADAIVVQDATLVHQPDVLVGLRPSGYVLLNTGRSLEEVGLSDFAAQVDDGHLVTVPATDLARRALGRPLPNAALLGALSALTGVIGLDALAKAIHLRFPGALGDANVQAAKAAHQAIETFEEEVQRA